MLQRKPSLVNRAFWNFLGASILTTVAAQLAVSTDAAIVSHLMGPHAMAAVNMAMPVLTTFLSLNSLLGVGGESACRQGYRQPRQRGGEPCVHCGTLFGAGGGRGGDGGELCVL